MAISFRVIKLFSTSENCSVTHTRKHCAENEILDKLIKEGNRKLVRKFSLSYPYTDNLISFNDKRCKEFISGIYPKELTISENTEFTSVASYLNLLFTRDKISNITTNYMTSVTDLASTL